MRQQAGGPGAWRRLRRRFYWVLVKGLLATARWIPITWGRWSVVRLARLGAALRRGEMVVAEKNLVLAFSEMEPGTRDRVLRTSIDAAGRNLFDTLAVERLIHRNGLVREAGKHGIVDELTRLAASGRGVVILTGHIGCWELFGAWLAREVAAAGLGPLAVITGTVHNPPVNKLLQERRIRMGLTVMPRDDGIRPVLEHLRAGGIVAVLMDQNLGAASEMVPFFGRPAPTVSGLARICLRTGVPLLPAAIRRDAEGTGHEVFALEPIAPGRSIASPTAEEVRGLLVECNLRLEEMIRRNPQEWIWFHDRWNTNHLDEGNTVGRTQ